jgi:Holliday junction resolvase RusA-like endonuclease
MPKSIKINLQRFTKKFDFRDSIHKRYFERALASEYTKTYQDQYFQKDTPVGISVTVYEKLPKVTNRAVRINGSAITNDSVFALLTLITKTLVYIAYDKVNQITEAYVQKLYSPSNSIEIEVYQIEE